MDDSIEMNKYASKRKPQRRVSDSSFESQKSKRKRTKPAKSSLASSDHEGYRKVAVLNRKQGGSCCENSCLIF